MSRRYRQKHAPRRPEPYAPVVHAIPETPPESGLAVYPRRLPGRPTLLTPEVEGRFLGMLMKGTYRNVAAQIVGLKPDTVEKWMKRGRGRMLDRPPTPEYVQFVRRVEQAEALARGDVEVNVVRRSKYDHNAGLAWLRTRYPDQWPRHPGGEEDDEDGFRAPAPPPMETTPQIAQQTNILMLDSKQWPELASQLIAQGRATRSRQAEAEAIIIEQQEEPSSGVPRHSRLDALRADDATD